MFEFSLHPRLDLATARARFAADRRVQLAPFLVDAAAERLAEHLAERGDWRFVVNAGEKVYEMSETARAGLTPGQMAGLEARIAAAARTGFQFRFESVRVPDEPEARAEADTLLDRFADFMSHGAARDALRHVTGASFDFADAQATRYTAGDFLTRHDDDVEGKRRHAAYVLGLSRAWRSEWGGLLMFHEPDGDVARGWAPRFNTLSLFAVPQTHSVSQVTAFAGEHRLSVTGWLRSS